MTSFWLFLSDLFKWSFGFYDFAGNVLNWILFIVASTLFCYWCYVLVTTLGIIKIKNIIHLQKVNSHTTTQNYTLKKINQIS